jgi:hypothetical protein
MTDNNITSENSLDVHEEHPRDQKVATRSSDPEISRVENIDLEDDDLKKDHMNYDRVDKDTHLVGQQFAWLTTCTYIAIFFVEYPTNRLIHVGWGTGV